MILILGNCIMTKYYSGQESGNEDHSSTPLLSVMFLSPFCLLNILLIHLILAPLFYSHLSQCYLSFFTNPSLF